MSRSACLKFSQKLRMGLERGERGERAAPLHAHVRLGSARRGPAGGPSAGARGIMNQDARAHTTARVGCVGGVRWVDDVQGKDDHTAMLPPSCVGEMERMESTVHRPR